MPSPPVIPPRPRKDRRGLLFGLVGGALLAMIVARLAMQWHLPLPVCGMRKLTGLPCPFCGGTRCLLALSHFEFARAFYFNPLVFLILLAAGACFLFWIVARRFNPPWSGSARPRRWERTVKIAAALLVLANWLYLWRFLPP